MEIWQDIEGYEGYYQVSNKGRVKSLRRNIFLKPSIQERGNHKRSSVKLCVNKKNGTARIHRLVAKAFIPNPLGYRTVNHKDGNSLKNNVENLEWCSQKQNVQHAIKTGLRKTHKFDKETLSRLYEEKTSKEIAVIYGVSYGTILKAIERHGLKKKPPGGQTKFNITKELLKKELKTKSKKQLADEIGCDVSLIRRYVRKMNLGGF